MTQGQTKLSKPKVWRLAVCAGIVAVVLGTPVNAQTDSHWAAAVDGNWSTAGRWNPAIVPNNSGGSTFDVTIDPTGSDYTVDLDSTISVNNLLISSSNARVHHTAGTLSASVIDVNSGYYRLLGGTIANSEIKSLVLGTSGRFVVAGTTDSYFDNVSINRTVDIGGTSTTAGFVSSGTLHVTNDLDLNATGGGLWFQGGGGEVILAGNQTVNGVASGNQKSEIVFNQQSGYIGRIRSQGGTLTIGPNVRIRNGADSANYVGAAGEGLLLQGEVVSTIGSRSITIIGDNWVNEGLLYQDGGGQINFDGTFSTANLGTWSSDNNDINGRLRILGTLNNVGQTLDLTKDANTGLGGSMTLGGGGTVVGGTIKAPSSLTPFRTNPGGNGFGTLDGVTLDGHMAILPGEVKVLNNLTLANGATVRVERGTTTSLARLTFAGNQSILGNGLIQFQGTSGTIGQVYAEAGGSLTIGSGVTVATGGSSGSLGISTSDINNAGTISAQTVSRILTVTAGTLDNSGTLQVLNDSTLNITAASILNSGVVNVATGTLNNSSAIANTGLVKGSGTITGDVVNSGVIAPGNSAGLLTIGDLTQTSAGELQFQLGGTTRGTQYDALVVDAILQLDGLIRVSLFDGFTPSASDMFDLLDWNTAVFGNYAFDFSAAGAPSGFQWDISQFEVDGTLKFSAVPEPGSFGLLLAGATCWWYRRRRSVSKAV